MKMIGTAAMQRLDGKKEQVAILQQYKSGNMMIMRRDGKREIVAGFVLSNFQWVG